MIQQTSQGLQSHHEYVETTDAHARRCELVAFVIRESFSLQL